jgi:hypothetical protein
LTYDGAHLELRTSSLLHERLSALLGRFVSQPVAAIGLESPQQFGLPKRRRSTAGERQAAVFRETFHEPAKQGTQALVQQRRGPQLEVAPS